MKSTTSSSRRTFQRAAVLALLVLFSSTSQDCGVRAFTTTVFAPASRSVASRTRLPYSDTVENAPLDDQQVKQLADETVAKRPKLPNLFTAITVRDFKRLVTSDQQSDFVVVRYYAPWCRACKKAEPMFLKLAQDRPDVKFVQVPILSSNSELIEQSGVTTIPWGQIYRPEIGLVQEAKLNTKHFSNFRTMVSALAP